MATAFKTVCAPCTLPSKWVPSVGIEPTIRFYAAPGAQPGDFTNLSMRAIKTESIQPTSYLVPWGRLELPIPEALVSKTNVYTIPPPGQLGGKDRNRTCIGSSPMELFSRQLVHHALYLPNLIGAPSRTRTDTPQRTRTSKDRKTTNSIMGAILEEE